MSGFATMSQREPIKDFFDHILENNDNKKEELRRYAEYKVLPRLKEVYGEQFLTGIIFSEKTKKRLKDSVDERIKYKFAPKKPKKPFKPRITNGPIAEEYGVNGTDYIKLQNGFSKKTGKTVDEHHEEFLNYITEHLRSDKEYMPKMILYAEVLRDYNDPKNKKLLEIEHTKNMKKYEEEYAKYEEEYAKYKEEYKEYFKKLYDKSR